MDMAPLELNPSLWSRLSHDLLLFQILPRLPLLYRLTLRTVCKLWHKFLVSQSYWDHCDSISSTPSLLLRFFVDRENCQVNLAQLYQYTANSWQNISTHLIPYKISSSYTPVCSEHGVVCFVKLAHGFLSLALCNPVLNEWIDMPLLLDSYNNMVALTFNIYRIIPRENGYFFVLVGDHMVIHLLDTETGLWEEIFDCGAFLGENNPGFTDMVAVGNSVFILIQCDSASFREQSAQLLRYDFLDKEVFHCPDLDEKLTPSVTSIFELNGEVVMVGQRRGSSHICFWKLDNGEKWSLIFILTELSHIFADHRWLSCVTFIKDHNRLYYSGHPSCTHACVAIDLSEHHNLQFDCRSEIIPLSHQHSPSGLFSFVFAFKPTIKRLL